MKSQIHAWTFLRPALLAVAAATSWVALSSTGASADSSSTRDSLVEAIDSSLTSVTATVTSQARDVLTPVGTGLAGGFAEAPLSTAPALVPAVALRPVAADATSLADHIVQSVPVVNAVVPAGTVASVVDPTVGALDGVLGVTGETIAPLAGNVLKPLDAILEPVISAVLPPAAATPGAALPVVTDLLGSVAPQPTPAAAVPALSGTIVAPDLAGQVSALPSDEHPTDTAPAAIRSLGPESPRGSGAAYTTSAPQLAPSVSLAEATPEDAPVSPPSDVFPGVPGTSTGGSSSSGGTGPTMPACISAYHLPAAAEGTSAVNGHLLTAPVPVSFDPGSSPD